MPAFAKATKKIEERKDRGASDSEKDEDGGYLMKEQNDHLHNGDGVNFQSLKKCMQDITDKILNSILKTTIWFTKEL